MFCNKKIDAMVSHISSNIDQLEQDLKEEYKKLIRISTDFDDIAAQFILLNTEPLSEPEKDYETTCFVEKLCVQINTTFGSERDTNLIFDAAMAVMDETSAAVTMTRN